MSTGNPKEYLTLPSGPENNFAVIYGKRLQNRYDCGGAETEQTYGESGSTKFSKIRLQLEPLSVNDSDFIYSMSDAQGKQIPYGTAGDCYSVKTDCRKGLFKVE